MAQAAIQIQVVWSDEDLLELATAVHWGAWAGVERAYVDSGTVRGFAEQLLKVAAGAQSKADFHSGPPPEVGALKLVVFEYSAARKLGVEVRIERIEQGPRGEPHIGVLSLTAPTEHGLVPQFAQELARLSERREGNATLMLLPEWPT